MFVGDSFSCRYLTCIPFCAAEATRWQYRWLVIDLANKYVYSCDNLNHPQIYFVNQYSITNPKIKSTSPN